MDTPHLSPDRQEREGSRGRRHPDSHRSDRRQLAERPVSLRRIGRLFADHRATLAVVVALIVASSAIGLAQPFLVRHVIDVALPRARTSDCWSGASSAWSASRSRARRSASSRHSCPPGSASR